MYLHGGDLQCSLPRQCSVGYTQLGLRSTGVNPRVGVGPPYSYIYSSSPGLVRYSIYIYLCILMYLHSGDLQCSLPRQGQTYTVELKGQNSP